MQLMIKMVDDLGLYLSSEGNFGSHIMLVIIDYGSQAWCPIEVSMLAELEDLQRTYKATG